MPALIFDHQYCNWMLKVALSQNQTGNPSSEWLATHEVAVDAELFGSWMRYFIVYHLGIVIHVVSGFILFIFYLTVTTLHLQIRSTDTRVQPVVTNLLVNIGQGAFLFVPHNLSCSIILMSCYNVCHTKVEFKTK